jgi:hypothetical protein
VHQDRTVDGRAGAELGRGPPDPDLIGPARREVIDGHRVDGAQTDGDGVDRLGSPGAPAVADGEITRDGIGQQPLRLVVLAIAHDPWGGMATGQPHEAASLAFELDTGDAGIPLQIPAAQPEREPPEVVAPHELRHAVAGQVEDRGWDGLIAEGVLRREQRELVVGHRGRVLSGG